MRWGGWDSNPRPADYEKPALMQRCLQLHEQHGPSHPWHSSHLIPPAWRSTNRATAAPTPRPTRLRTVTATGRGTPGWRYPAGPPPASHSPAEGATVLPITTPTNSTPRRPHFAPAVLEADPGEPPRTSQADRQILRSERLALTEPRVHRRADDQRRHRQDGRPVRVTGTSILYSGDDRRPHMPK
jgi:hypothetical protein